MSETTARVIYTPDAPAHEMDAVDSTNAEAWRLAAAGVAPPFWVIAARQTAGRGRAGRSWVSEPGNFYSTVIFEVYPTETAPLTLLPLVVGLAVVEGIRAVARPDPGRSVRLKWPNDILLDSAKCGGILLESQPGEASGGYRIAAGIGLNLRHHPALDASMAFPATNFTAGGIDVDPRALFAALSRELAGWLSIWAQPNGATTIRDTWLANTMALGSAVSVKQSDSIVSGRFCGISDAGELVIATADGDERRITFGDVMMQVVTD